MSITLREAFQPTEVENYPDGPGPLRGAKLQERFRGKHQLQRDENGLEKCVACFLCAAACPSNCIYIEAAENTADPPHLLRRALRQDLQHRLQPLHLLRILRRSLSRPTPSPTATALSSPRSTPPTWSCARRTSWSPSFPPFRLSPARTRTSPKSSPSSSPGSRSPPQQHTPEQGRALPHQHTSRHAVPTAAPPLAPPVPLCYNQYIPVCLPQI